METPKSVKNVVKQLEKTKERLNALEFDAHWYRRVFHAFGSSFLIYYLLPAEDWITILKVIIPFLVLCAILILEYMRLRGKIGSNYFFGLRIYEKKRIGSYLYFLVAVLILLLFFPQQIAIPCILCASLADPIIGELRHRFGRTKASILGFFLCMLFFIITWFKAAPWIMISVSLIGATAAVIGETKKLWWLDDDFMIQMFPAITLLLLWMIITQVGLNIMPEQILYPVSLPW